MTLAAFQDTLAELIVSHGGHAAVGQRQLSANDRAWFETLTHTDGFRLTCAVQRWWRTAAVADSAPLALQLLHVTSRMDVFTGYLDSQFGASLFPLLDGLAFLDYLIDRAARIDVPHLEAVAAFERGLLRLTQSASLGEIPSRPLAPLDARRTVMRHPLADLIHFSAPPEQVLAAIMDGQIPPQPSGDYYLLLAPRLPRFSRLASRAESRLLEGRSLEEPEWQAAHASLWAAGALVYSRP